MYCSERMRACAYSRGPNLGTVPMQWRGDTCTSLDMQLQLCMRAVDRAPQRMPVSWWPCEAARGVLYASCGSDARVTTAMERLGPGGFRARGLGGRWSSCKQPHQMAVD